MARTVATPMVVLIGLHSAGVGVLLLVAPFELFGAVGWQVQCPAFFLHQVGVFHLLLGAFYLWGWLRAGSLAPIIGAKSVAVVFLAVEFARLGELGVLLAAVADGLIAVAAVVLWCLLREPSRAE